jgi:serine/threonine protein kinase
VRLVRPLGRGGMGAVWVAEHQTLRTEVVVKFMSDALASDPVSLARFSHEASAAAAVKSPHVVHMLDHGFTTDGTPFIVMELLDGEDLRKRLVREQVIPLTELGVILSQACKALGRAHSSGIVHRDIKPDNIFLCHTDDGEPFVKLLDFGIAKSCGPAEFHVTQTGVMVGTPFYMSPEQAVGSPPVDATTDLWSLGVVAFEAMTGTRPFDGLTIGALTIAICNERPPVPSAVNPGIPTEVDAWLARACARERTERFPTAKAMSEALPRAVRSAAAPKSVPLAFDETSLSRGSDRPPFPAPPVRSPPFTASPAAPPAPPESASELATTTTALSRTNDQPHVVKTPFAPVQKPRTRPVTSRRVPYLAAAAALIALIGLGIGGGFVFAVRDVASSAEAVPSGRVVASAPSPPPPAATSIVAPPPPPESAAVPPVAPPPPVPAVAAAVKPPLVHPVAPPSAHAAGSAALPHLAGSVAASPGAALRGCDPPFYFDAANNKVFKKECL